MGEIHVTSEPVPPSRASSFRWFRMAQKELREILRDRRTIITLIGMPLLIYPLLGVTFQKLLVTQATNKSKTEYRLCFANDRDSRIFRHVFRQAESLRHPDRRLDRPMDTEPEGTSEDPYWVLLDPRNPDASVDIDLLVANRTADLGIRLQDGDEKGPWHFELVSRTSSPYSLDARRAVEERLQLFSEESLLNRLKEFDSQAKEPLTVSQKQVSPTDATSQFSMATLIPLILILMTVTGAVYPAIDLTAGERERGTLEALISAPVPRHELLFAKYLAVLTVAMLTAIANLTSMVITAYANGMEQLLFGSGGIHARLLFLLLGLLVVFAGFFAAVILILTSFARSFKEAQAYLIPVMLVSLAPGIFCLMPGIEMSAGLSVTPLVNIVILARDLVDGRARAIWVVASLLSTILYSAVALGIAAKIFGTDAVLYGSEGSWTDLTRRPSERRPAPTISQAMLTLAVLFPTFLLLSGLPRRLAGDSVVIPLVGNAIITIVLFAILPAAMAVWNGVDLKEGFRLRLPPIASFLGAIILGLSLWPIAIELARHQSSSFEQSKEIKEQFERISASLNAVSLAVKLLTLAVIPAICEEFFFRGYLLSAFRRQMSPGLSILLTGALFGLFHVIAMLAFERFIPTFFLGLVLGWVCYRTGSLYPGIVLHTTHNALIISMQTYQKELAKLGFGGEAADRVPTTWLVTSVITVIVAVAILRWATRRRQELVPVT